MATQAKANGSRPFRPAAPPRPGEPAGPAGPVITCPRCGEHFALTDALAEELAAHLVAGRTATLQQQLSTEIRAEFADDLKYLQETLRGRDNALREKDETLRENSAEIQRLRGAEADLRRERRALEDATEAMRLEQERLRDAIRTEERAAADRRSREHHEDELRRKDEQHAIEQRELNERLERVTGQLEAALRKGAPGSRQQEGYAKQELFAEDLKRRFPADEVTCTPRGMAGADVTQQVRAGEHGCGTILWECKRAAAWNGSWIGKLAEDASGAQADIAVIVSEALPPGRDGSDRIDGIWVTDYGHAMTLAAGLREAITLAWRHRLAAAGRDDTASRVYDYIATGGFADRYTAAERTLHAMEETLRKEKRYYEQAWSQREQQIDKTRDSFAGIVADLIRAGAEVPPATRAELPAPDLAVVPPAAAVRPAAVTPPAAVAARPAGVSPPAGAAPPPAAVRPAAVTPPAAVAARPAAALPELVTGAPEPME